MNDLFIKLIELRTRLITYSKLVDSTRELGISSSIMNFLEDLKENHREYDLDTARYNAALIANSARPQELRETLLESLINSLNKVGEERAKEFLFGSLKDLCILEILFEMRMFDQEFIDNLEALLTRYSALRPQMPEKYSEMREVVGMLCNALKTKIDEVGMTVKQTQVDCVESWDQFNYLVENGFISSCTGSEYRSILVVGKMFCIFSVLNTLYY